MRGRTPHALLFGSCRRYLFIVRLAGTRRFCTPLRPRARYVSSASRRGQCGFSLSATVRTVSALGALALINLAVWDSSFVRQLDGLSVTGCAEGCLMAVPASNI